MYEYYPLIVIGAVVGCFSIVLLTAYLMVKDKKQTMGFDRQMEDREIMRRLLGYAKPYRRAFLLVGFLMLLSIAYDVVSPLIIGRIEQLMVGEFAMAQIYRSVALYLCSVPMYRRLCCKGRGSESFL